MSSFWAKIDKGLGFLSGLLAFAGSVFLVLLVAVTVVAVFARYFLNDPIFGIEDVSSMVLTVVVAAAIAYGARHGAHVSVNVVGLFAGRGVTRFTDVAARLLGALVAGGAAYALFVKGSCGFKCGAFTPNIEIMHQPFYYALSIAMALYALQLIAHLAIGLVHFGGEDPNEISD